MESRAIAPRPPGVRRDDDFEPSRREHISTACTACKSRKCRCSGGQPCDSCIKNNTPCVYDANSDNRRKVVLKRKIESLEDDRDLLVRLLGTLREDSNRRVVPLLNLIRSDASLDEIKEYIDHHHSRGELERTPELVEVVDQLLSPRAQTQESEDRSRRRILDAKRLSDVPRWKVPANPWTSVIDDDEVVSHLVSLWFTWCHPYHNWIDRELLLRDMRAGDVLNADYCSPFLVNIILANACAYSDYPESYADPDEACSKGQHFYDEAKRLYEQEEGVIALTTVQALAVLWLSAALLGKDRRGWVYQGQLAYAMEEFLRIANRQPDRYEPQVVNDMVWGIWNIGTVGGLVYQRLPLFKTPQIACLKPPAAEEDQDEWIPYPSQSASVAAYLAQVRGATTEINKIVYDICQTFFNETNGLEHISFAETQRNAEDLRGRLQRWTDGLADCLQDTGTRSPHLLSLQYLFASMYHHTIIMTIYGFVVKKAKEEAIPPAEYQHIQALRFSSSRSVARLMNLHRQSWGLDRMPSGNMQWITVAQSTLLEDLDSIDNREAFVSLSLAAKAAARRWPMGKGLLRSIAMTARQQGVVLPVETDTLFAELENSWTARDTREFSSVYPVFAMTLQADRTTHHREVALDRFLDKWDALHLD
ncbi:hypothetical protein ASPZODRAFT_104512 [Penicilliopsis zonata CBS 506.65]|uniref:Zn(2)-C6 fungal-type domain-containing protein n=1 Tax=Penicilliopsis zonata CBS 506.65 TaxID=1073090 RepID=A0A1L9S6M2_9EURO|nr:hypothetical protein ASPZODRAFT_104512 [Penicilliopsis zonata CBS 506.65]OJJ42822.1 hypothetical protein ASPZODRAFT_104512 [Penicilliopsis zonata CBS 506.65]